MALLIDDQAEAIASAAAILEFAPTAPIRQKILALQPARYVSIDLVSHFRPSVLGSITSLLLVTGSIDYILCYHILEHVDNDGAAIRELARVMTPQTTAIIQVPRRKGSPTEEDPDASAEDRVVRFGQADHVRYYSHDFEKRLFRHGLIPALLTPRLGLAVDEISRFGLQPDEEVWICRSKNASPASGAPRIRLTRVTCACSRNSTTTGRTGWCSWRVNATRPIRHLMKRLRRLAGQIR